MALALAVSVAGLLPAPALARDTGLEAAPPQSGEVAGLRELAPDDNELTGTIPRQLGSRSDSERIHVDNSDLSNSDLSGMTWLAQPHLPENGLSGAFQPQSATPSNAAALNLSGNDLTGNVTLAVSPTTVSENGGDTEITVTAELDAGTAWANRLADSGSIVTVSVAGSGSTEAVVGFEAVADFDIIIARDNASGVGAFTLKPTADSAIAGNETITVSASGTGARGVADAVLTAANEPTVTLEDYLYTKSAKPAGFKAEADDGAVVLSWTNPDDATITKWQYTQDGGTTWKDMAGSGKDTAVYRVSSLSNGTAYTFQIRAVGAGGTAGTASDSASATPAAAPGVQVSNLVAGLSIPWDLDFTPDGTMLFTERGGGIKSRLASGKVQDMTADLADLYSNGETGLMGIVVDPDFGSNRRFYTCQGHRSGTSPNLSYEIQVIAWTINDTYTTATRVNDPLVGGIPANGSNGRHGGCRLTFGPDGYLWISTGDAARSSAPQDLTSLGGKVLRVVSTTGAGVSDNPFAANSNANANLIYTYGHRNVQGLTLRPGTTQMWSVEHGPSEDDEINLLVSGGNYGWKPGPSYGENVPMTDLTTYPDAVVARWSSGSSTIATSGGVFLEGDHWGIWEGRLAVATLADRTLRVFHFTPDGALAGQVTALTGRGRLRSAVMGPDGALYVTTSDGGGSDEILRITPASAPEFPDDVVTVFTVAENLAPDTSIGDPVAATDLNGDPLDYKLSGAGSDDFTIDNAGRIRTASDAVLDFETTPSYTLTVSVTDGNDASGQREQTARRTVDDTVRLAINVTNVNEDGAVEFDSESPQAGTALTATLSDPDGGIADLTWTWETSSDKSSWATATGVPANSGLASAYTPADADNYLRATASYTDAANTDTANKNTANAVSAAQTTRPKPTLILSDAEISEDGGSAAVTATLAAGASFQTTITISTAAVSPTVAADFTQTGSTLTIASGATTSTGTVTITAVDNDVDAENKMVTVSATVSNSAVAAPDNVTLTIIDDDEDKVAPTVSSLRIASEPTAHDAYAPGETIAVEVTFSEPVWVTGEPCLLINVGEELRRPAAYASGSGTSALLFSYTVVTADRDKIGVGVYGYDATNWPLRLSCSEGSADAAIRDAADNDADLRHGWLWYDSKHKVGGPDVIPDDRTSPTITGMKVVSSPETGDTYGDGETIRVQVTFSEPVIANYSPRMAIWVGLHRKELTYREGTGTDKLIFGYRVRPEDRDNQGISVPTTQLPVYEKLDWPSITDSADNFANVQHQPMPTQSGHKVAGSASDSTAPTVKEVVMFSAPGTYVPGQELRIHAVLSEPVRVVGEPYLELTVGGKKKTAKFLRLNPDTMAFAVYDAVMPFTYTVDEGDADGIAIGANSVNLPEGASIRDLSTNDAVLTHDSIGELPNYQIVSTHILDGGLTITSSPTEGATYRAGETITVSVRFNQNVTVTGIPTLMVIMDPGRESHPRARYSGGSGTDALTFDHVVVSGDRDEDGIEIGYNGIALDGSSSIKDDDDNDALLEHGPLTAQVGHKVDGSPAKSPAPSPLPNSAPVFSPTAVTRSVAENSAANTNVGAPIPAADDADGDTLAYALTGADAGVFAFNESSRQISVATGATLDYETRSSYALTMTVSDGKASDGAADTAVDDSITVTLSVVNVDEEGTVSLDAETPQVGSALTATVSDPDDITGGSLTWQWQRSPAGTTADNLDATNFEDIPGATGAAYTPVGEDVDRWLQVAAGYADGHGPGKGARGRTASPVAAANSEPQFASDSAARSVVENAAAGTLVGDPIPAADDADGDTLTYALAGADAGVFAFNGSSRQISVATGATLDYETQSSYTLTVTVSDGRDAAGEADAGVDDSIEVTISVVNVDEPPAPKKNEPDMRLMLNRRAISENGGAAAVRAQANEHVTGEAITVIVSVPEGCGCTLSGNRTLTIQVGEQFSAWAVTITAVDNDIRSPQDPEVKVTGSASRGGPVRSVTLTIEDDD